MRFRSAGKSGEVVAVCGVNTVSFGLLPTDAVKDGLLGFAVERTDPVEHERYYLPGFKVFESVLPEPPPGLFVTTFEHPVQSFVWDDFTAKPDRPYTYRFHPLKGTPKNIDRRTAALTIKVHTEPLVNLKSEHDVFFNRGVGSSQAYTRKFGNAPIDSLAPDVRAAAISWLSRDLGRSLVRFIDDCVAGDRLLGCFYEFRYAPALDAFTRAIDRGVDVRLVVDMKVNETTDKDGKFHESFPRVANLAAIAAAGLPADRIRFREARANAIAHNKFMVRVGASGPAEVWTGSTNLSLGGVAGQTNVGHWIRNRSLAESYAQYWQLLDGDPGNHGPDTPDGRRENTRFRAAVEQLSPVMTDLHDAPAGMTPVFSPRQSKKVLNSYAALLDSPDKPSCITLAFSIAKQIKEVLKDNTPQSHGIVFMMLEKQDRPGKNDKATFVRLDASNNVYQAWGSFIRDPVYQWAKEANPAALGLNSHVLYIHSKFMLVDPLGADPIIVTGSANFSDDSTTDNDENMVLIRGSHRAADIYWTEFNRLFNHYYFRSVVESLSTQNAKGGQGGPADPKDHDSPSVFLDETSGWVEKYRPGTLRAKRLAMFANMAT